MRALMQTRTLLSIPPTNSTYSITSWNATSARSRSVKGSAGGVLCGAMLLLHAKRQMHTLNGAQTAQWDLL